MKRLTSILLILTLMITSCSSYTCPTYSSVEEPVKIDHPNKLVLVKEKPTNTVDLLLTFGSIVAITIIGFNTSRNKIK